jgi:hypothetical protein
MSSKPILDRLRHLAETHPELQQFGQDDDDLVHNGKTACTHTICQFLSLAWNGTIPTLNEVNKLAGMPANAINEVTRKPRGMRPSELETFLAKTKIPMKVVRGLAFAKMFAAADNGPVMYGMRYGSAPVKTKTHPNGATQKGVPNIRHAVVLLGSLSSPAAGGGPKRVDAFRKEPNHGSPNRPERPPYDTISAHDVHVEYEDYRTKLGEPLYAVIPTKKLQVIGALAPLKPSQPPPLVLVALEPFSGTATVKGDNHSAVQLADQKFIHLPNGTVKRVVALGRLEPRLAGPAGDRTHVALVSDAGSQAAIFLRADITLTTDDGVVVPPPPTEADEDPPASPPIGMPMGGAFDEAGDDVGNDALPPD